MTISTLGTSGKERTCPECRGLGYFTVSAFVLRVSGCSLEQQTLHCALCAGTGNEIPERRAWRERGEKLRADRQARDLSLGEEARRRGISVANLSDMERGLAEPIEARP